MWPSRAAPAPASLQCEVRKGKSRVTCPNGAIGPNAADITFQASPSLSLYNRGPETQNRDVKSDAAEPGLVNALHLVDIVTEPK